MMAITSCSPNSELLTTRPTIRLESLAHTAAHQASAVSDRLSALAYDDDVGGDRRHFISLFSASWPPMRSSACVSRAPVCRTCNLSGVIWAAVDPVHSAGHVWFSSDCSTAPWRFPGVSDLPGAVSCMLLIGYFKSIPTAGGIRAGRRRQRGCKFFDGCTCRLPSRICLGGYFQFHSVRERVHLRTCAFIQSSANSGAGRDPDVLVSGDVFNWERGWRSPARLAFRCDLLFAVRSITTLVVAGGGE